MLMGIVLIIPKQNMLCVYQQQQMLNCKKITHIVFPVFLSISYAFFMVQLSNSQIYQYFALIVFCILFFIYSLHTYAAFHFPPTQPNLHTTNFDLNLIFNFKLTQEKRRQLQLALRECTQDKREQLQKQYINEHKKPSFCDICERVQPPRAQHCLFCDCCIMGKHKHSHLLGFCIGQNNQTTYLMYLLISKIICLYSFFSLSFVQLTSNHFNKLSSVLQIYSLLLIFLLFILIIFYFKEFSLLFQSMESNKTICESNDPFLKNLTFKRQRQPLTYVSCVTNLVNLGKIGQTSSWIVDLQQDQQL